MARKTDLAADVVVAILVILAALALAVGISLFLAFPVTWLWNELFTENSILGVALPKIGYWQALGLLILTNLLFNQNRSGSGSKKD